MKKNIRKVINYFQIVIAMVFALGGIYGFTIQSVYLNKEAITDSTLVLFPTMQKNTRFLCQMNKEITMQKTIRLSANDTLASNGKKYLKLYLDVYDATSIAPPICFSCYDLIRLSQDTVYVFTPHFEMGDDKKYHLIDYKENALFLLNDTDKTKRTIYLASLMNTYQIGLKKYSAPNYIYNMELIGGSSHEPKIVEITVNKSEGIIGFVFFNGERNLRYQRE